MTRGRAHAGAARACRTATLVVGLRPEAMRPAVDGMPALDFRVDVVEPLGDEVIVHGALAAELIAAATDASGWRGSVR